RAGADGLRGEHAGVRSHGGGPADVPRHRRLRVHRRAGAAALGQARRAQSRRAAGRPRRRLAAARPDGQGNALPRPHRDGTAELALCQGGRAAPCRSLSQGGADLPRLSLMRRHFIAIAATLVATAIAPAGAETLRFQSGSYPDFRQLLSRQAASATVTIDATLTFPDEKRDRYPAIVII